MGLIARCKTGQQLIVVCSVVVLALAFAARSLGSVADSGKVSARSTVSGQVAVGAVRATINHPSAIYFQLIGNITTGSVTIGCSKGSSISSNKYEHDRAGVYSVPIKPSRAERCELVGRIRGSGQVTIAIRGS